METKVIEDFYGVYLLYCMNSKYKGRTYIGYTVDPNRRIKQHNKGKWAGGACKTSNRGPWKMVMIVHGFPNNIAALRFEWAWQNPNKTTRLQHVLNIRKTRKENVFQYTLRILSEMLRVGPWNRLPLYIQWLEESFATEFPLDKEPPIHMPICYGKIKSKRLKKNKPKDAKTLKNDIVVHEALSNYDFKSTCFLCKLNISIANTAVSCLKSDCNLICHVTCLSDLFLEDGEYVPIQGTCPCCQTNLIWGDLIRKMKGCTYNDDDLFSKDEGSESSQSSGGESDNDSEGISEKVQMDGEQLGWYLSDDDVN